MRHLGAAKATLAPVHSCPDDAATILKTPPPTVSVAAVVLVRRCQPGRDQQPERRASHEQRPRSSVGAFRGSFAPRSAGIRFRFHCIARRTLLLQLLPPSRLHAAIEPIALSSPAPRHRPAAPPSPSLRLRICNPKVTPWRESAFDVDRCHGLRIIPVLPIQGRSRGIVVNDVEETTLTSGPKWSAS